MQASLLPILHLLIITSNLRTYYAHLKGSPEYHRRSFSLMVPLSAASPDTTSSITFSSKPVLLKSIVNALISFVPLFKVMKLAARGTLIKTAEKDGIPWTSMEDHLIQNNEKLKYYLSEIENAAITYPKYYVQQFHGYDDGNLNWKAAYECESAAKVLAARTYAELNLNVDAAFDRMRTSFTNSIKSYALQYRSAAFNTIADIGCSVGISTFYLARAFPSVEKLDAYDLSPYFLAVAKYRQNVVLDESFIAQEDKQLLWPHLSNFPASSISKIRWLHSNAENMKDAASESYDLIVLGMLLHELPQVGQRTTKQYDF